MRQWIRSHLTFANVVSLAALFIALGGTATAVTYVVSSNSQVGPGTISGHEPPTGTHANVIAGSINATDLAPAAVGTNKLAGGAVNTGKLAGSAVTSPAVADNSLTGSDINETTLNATLPSAFNTDGGPACDPDNASKTCVTTSLNLPRAHPVLILLSGIRETSIFDDPTTPTDYTDLVIGACYPRVDGANIGGPSAVLTQREAFNDGGWSVGPENFSALQITNLAAGSHSIEMRCDETDGDLAIVSPSITAVALGT